MKYIDKLRNSGLRPTKQRLQICQVLFDTEKTFHFTINELDQKIKNKLESKISLKMAEYLSVIIAVVWNSFNLLLERSD